MQDDNTPDDLIFPQDSPAPHQDAPVVNTGTSAAPVPNDLVFPPSLDDARTNLETAEARARVIRRQAIEAGTEAQIAYDPAFAGATQDVANARRAETAARNPFGMFGQSWGVMSPQESQAWTSEAVASAQASVEQAQQRVATAQQSIDHLLAQRQAAGDQDTSIPAVLRADLGYAQSQLSEARREQARIAQIESGQTAPARLSATRSAVENVNRSFVDTIAASAVKAFGAATAYVANLVPGPTVEPDDNLFYNMGESISRWASDTFPGDPARQSEFAQQLANGGGSMLGFMGSGMTAAVLRAGPRGMVAATALFGGASQGTEAFDEASRALLEIKERHEQETGQKILFTPMERDRLTALGLGFLVGTSEAVPLARMYQGAARTGIRGRVQNAITQGAEEGTQEFGQQLASNAIAQQTYDPDRPLGRGVAEGTGVGLILGAGMGFGMRPHGSQQTTPPPVPPPESRPMPEPMWLGARSHGATRTETPPPVEQPPPGQQESPVAQPESPVPPQEPAQPQAAISGFYAPAERAIETSRRLQGPPQAWLNDLKKSGVSNDELDWMGFPQWMEEHQGRPVSREEVAEFIRENGANLVEVVQGRANGRTREEVAQQQFGLPWDQLNVRQQFWAQTAAGQPVKFSSNFPAGVTNPRNFLVQVPGLNYESPHFGGPTVSFIRVGDVAGPNGERVLLVHGNQSELHQQAEKQGYSDEVSPNPRGWETSDGSPAFAPNAPLKGDRWWQLGLKLALRQAVAEGYDAVAISTADQVKATDGNAPKSLYDSKMPSWLGKYVKPMGGVVERAPSGATREKLYRTLDDAVAAFPRGSIVQKMDEPSAWSVHAPGRRTIFGRSAGELLGTVLGGADGFRVVAKDPAVTSALKTTEPETRTQVRITPQMRESISKGQPLFGGRVNHARRRDAITAMLKMGRPHQVLDSITNNVLRTLQTSKYVSMVPAGTDVGALTRIEPIRGVRPDDGVTAIFRTMGGGELRLPLPLRHVLGFRAFRIGGEHTSTGADGVLFLRFDPVDNAEKRLSGELRHEALHSLRGQDLIPAASWLRLVGHAESLQVPQFDMGEMLFWVGDPEHQLYNGVTIREAYQEIYAGRQDIQEALDQEAVTHMLELHHHGYFSDEQMAPVRDIIDAMESGELAGGGVNTMAEPAMAIAGPRAKTASKGNLAQAQKMAQRRRSPGGAGPMFAIGGGGGPVSLVSFIRAQGGIRDQTGDLRQIFDKSGTKGHIPGIINNKTGVPIDTMRERLVEAGYLEESGPDRPAVTTVNDVIELVRRAASGERVFPRGETATPVETGPDVARILDDAYRMHQEAGIEYNLTEAQESRVVDLVTTEGLSVDDAVERAVMESVDGYELGESEAARPASRGDQAQGQGSAAEQYRPELSGNPGENNAGAGEVRPQAGSQVVPVTPPPVPPSSGGGDGGLRGPPGGDIIPPDRGRGPRRVGAAQTVDTSRNWTIGDWARAARDKWYSLGRTAETWWNPTNGLPQLEQYRIGRYRMLGRIGHAEEMTNQIWKDFKDATKADKKAAYTYLTTRGVSENGIVDPKVRQAAVGTKRLFNGLGAAAVERGLIPQESLDKYRDQYLPRLYLEHILRKGSMLGFSGNARPSDLGWTKKRGDIDKETRVLMGEILDPGYLAARGIFRMHRDMMIIDFLSEISNNDDWVFDRGLMEFNGRRVSPYFLRAEAQALRERADYEPDDGYRNAMLSMAADMENASAPYIRANENVPDGFKQIPDTKRYGMLRGMMVRKEIVDDLLPSMDLIPEDASWYQKFLSPQGGGGKFNALWKAYHVPLNPSTQVRNVISNVIMMNLSGMSPIRIATALGKAAHEMATNGPIYKTAVDMGLKTSGFSEQELRNVSRAWLNAEAELRREGAWGTVFYPWQIIKHIHDTVLRGAGDLYQWSEGVFKTAMMVDAVENQGMTPEQAFLHAQKWLFDYSDTSKTVRYLRSAPVGVPFACVDDTTEMLTQRGWVSAYDAKIGDMAASLDMETGALKWRLVQDIFLDRYDGPMVHVVDRHLDMLMTPDHKVVTYKKRKSGGKRLEITRASRLVSQDHIPVAADFEHEPRGEPVSDDIVEIVGWYVTEGTPHPLCKQIWIYQNVGPKADRIRDALVRAGFTFREADTKLKTGNTLKTFQVHAQFGAIIRDLCPRKQLVPEFIMRLSKQQIRLLVDTMIDGDGSRGKNGRTTFIQKDNQTLSSFTMALTILGCSYGVSRKPDSRSGVLAVGLRSNRHYCVKRARKTEVSYAGNIWCPSVAGTGTWVARRNGRVFITHNTYYYKVLPRLLEVAGTKPWRFIPYVILPYVMGQLFMNAWNAHDDDEERKRNPNRPNPVNRLAMTLPEYLRTKSYAFIMPGHDARGRWQFFDFGYLLPWSMFHETAQALSQGNITDAMRQAGFLGGPLLNLYQFIASKGTDSFTGRKVVDPRDPTSSQILNTMQWLWDQAAPPLLTSKGALARVRDAYNDVPDRNGDPGLTMAQSIARLFGLNVYPVDPDTSRGRQISRMQFEIKEAEKRNRSVQRDQSLSVEARRRDAEARAADIVRRRRELAEYINNTEVHPRLRIERPRRPEPPSAQPQVPTDLIFPKQ